MGDLFRYRNDPNRLINFQVVGVFLVCAFFQVGGWPACGGMSGFSFVSIEGGKEMPKLCLGLFLSAFFLDIDVLALVMRFCVL